MGKNSFQEVYCGCNYSTHAEIDAIKKLPNFYKGSVFDLVVIRTTNSFILRNSKPCSKCIELLHYFCRKKKIKIRNVYYSTEEGKITKIKFSQLHNSHQTLTFRLKHNKK